MTEKQHSYSRKFNFNERRLSNRAIERWLNESGSADDSTSQCMRFWRKQSPAHEQAADELDDFMQCPELNVALDSVAPDDILAPSKTCMGGKLKWQWAAGFVLPYYCPCNF